MCRPCRADPGGARGIVHRPGRPPAQRPGGAAPAPRPAGRARGLVARGVQVGERVALVLPNGPDMIAARFAVAQAGAVAVPVSFRLHAAELAQILVQSEASALITMEEFREVNRS